MAKKKPTVDEINALLKLEEKSRALYEELDEARAEFLARFGEGVFYTHNTDGEYKFLKIEVIDNLEKAQRGEDVWKPTKFSPVTVKSTLLKREPKNVEIIEA